MLEKNHEELTRSGAPEVHCLLLSQSDPPSRSADSHERASSANTDAWVVRSTRSVRLDRGRWMKVPEAPLHILAVRPPTLDPANGPGRLPCPDGSFRAGSMPTHPRPGTTWCGRALSLMHGCIQSITVHRRRKLSAYT